MALVALPSLRTQSQSTALEAQYASSASRASLPASPQVLLAHRHLFCLAAASLGAAACARSHLRWSRQARAGRSRRRNVVLRRNQLEESGIEESGDALIPAMPIGRLVQKGSTTGLEYDPFDAPEFIEDEHGGGIFSWMPVTAEGGLMPEGEYDEQSFEVPADRLEYLQGAGWLQAGSSEDYRAYIVGEISEVHGRKWQRVVLKGRKDSVREGALRLMDSVQLKLLVLRRRRAETTALGPACRRTSEAGRPEGAGVASKSIGSADDFRSNRMCGTSSLLGWRNHKKVVVPSKSSVCITSASNVAAVAGFHLLLPTSEYQPCSSHCRTPEVPVPLHLGEDGFDGETASELAEVMLQAAAVMEPAGAPELDWQARFSDVSLFRIAIVVRLKTSRQPRPTNSLTSLAPESVGPNEALSDSDGRSPARTCL
ncbi:hypothetical protein AK812_SmicGene31691 [Symbiodinium microadriaticum]|uniref:Uncharacterized protein n=1 Tax=Symbiodinium microadriaticum TaxID=2951 RepID=A0A1Q9CW19_SYMMI|nr:hypothetical protein AK812_SmicGene31691 [Symbiodinium microadriaticum]